jgi:UDP-4-amino-4,6-dideoxy-N-acetyl-beta-L-altrosamine transaminase
MREIPYGRQNISEEDIREVTKVLKSDFLTQGPCIVAFEKAFASYVGSEYAVAVSNGTAALHLCALALDVKEGVNVITSPITFAASANCVKYAGGEIHFADIDRETYTLSLDKTKQLILSKPKGYFSGIIPVDLAGYPVQMEAFRKLADEHEMWIIEDACHAPGAYFVDSHGQKVFSGNGKYADLSIFSFHPVKHIACGEGGMVTTNNERLYQKLLEMRTHGITKNPTLLTQNPGGWYYEMQELGYNYRLTDIQAALGLSQLKRADHGLEIRRKIAIRYEEAFLNIPGILGQSGYESNHAYHLYIIECENRLELYNHLRKNKVYCQVHYIPVHLMPYYRNLGWEMGDFPIAENYYSRCLSLPMFPTLTVAEQQYVINLILEFYS